MRTGTKLPLVRVELDGKALSQADGQALTQVMVSQSPSAPSLCELTFEDPEGSLRVPTGVGIRSDLRVAVGELPRTLFHGETTAVEFEYNQAQGRTVKVRAYDRLHRLRSRRPQRVHVDVGLADLVRELTSDLNVSLEGDTTSPVWQRLIQHSESDLTLLRRLADACGLHFVLDGATMRFFSLEGYGEPIGLRYGENLLAASVELNSDPTVPAARGQGWNPWLAEAREGVAERPRVGRRIAYAEPAPASDDPVFLTNLAVQADTQADATAQAELDRRSAAAVVLSGVAAGDINLRPGTAIAVEGLAPELSGRYALTCVTHWIDADRGYVSEFSTLPPASPSGGQDQGPGLALGVVSQVADPAGLGRVKVELVSCGGLESDWMQTLAPGGGEGKGLVTVPDVGDRVAVLFLNGDLAQGVVLGGLYGSAGPPDAGVEAGRVKRLTLRSPSGHFLRLDDTEGAVRFENNQGSFVELGRERLLVHAEGDLEIEAPGKTLVLRAAAVDFQQG